MVTGGLIGVMGGFMYAYQNSAGRIMGFFPNDHEVAHYKKWYVALFSVTEFEFMCNAVFLALEMSLNNSE